MARTGQIINFICREDQIIRLLREITFNDGIITSRQTTEEGVCITLRKT